MPDSNRPMETTKIPTPSTAAVIEKEYGEAKEEDEDEETSSAAAAVAVAHAG